MNTWPRSSTITGDWYLATLQRNDVRNTNAAAALAGLYHSEWQRGACRPPSVALDPG